MIRPIFPALLLAAGVAVAAPVPKEDDAARLARVYGGKSDPAGDARFEMTGERLRIVIPGRTVPRRPERGESETPQQQAMWSWKPTPPNAPRVWREVAGDFTATVRASFPLRPKSRPEEYWLPRTAGLVAWAGEKDHAAVFRCEGLAKGQVIDEFRAVLTHLVGVRIAAAHAERSDAGYLRMRRAGKVVTGSYSGDGKEWTDFLPDDVEWPATVKVGVYAKHLTDVQFDAVFDEYTLTVPKK